VHRTTPHKCLVMVSWWCSQVVVMCCQALCSRVVLLVPSEKGSSQTALPNRAVLPLTGTLSGAK
jgi:hypothetical protein